LNNPERQYIKRTKYYQQLLQKQNRWFNVIVYLKLLVLGGGLGTVVLFSLYRKYPVSGGLLFVTIFLFVYLEVKHLRVIHHKKYSTALCEVNEQALKRLHHEWKEFRDTGEEFRDENHPYSGDLDIFGPGSLYQWINTAATFTGRRKLQAFLTTPPEGVDQIYRRQESISELAKNLNWRQRFMAESKINPGLARDPAPLIQWAHQQNRFFLQLPVKIILRGFPALTILLIILSLITPRVPYYLPLFTSMIQLLLLIPGGKERHRIFGTTYLFKDNLKIYQKMLGRFETKRSNSKYLIDLGEKLRNQDHEPAFRQINRLEKIVDAISNQYNFFYFFINVITLWDYQCLMALEGWKEKSGRYLENWLDTLGEIEALSSLAVIQYDHPGWAIPQFVASPPVYSAKGLGHPLLPKTRVCNDLKIETPAGILMITGSNMSGKSTFLRTAGINLVLAYAGAPVCAETFCASLMNVYSCMRVSDNLEKNISTFYAELLRIKLIVMATRDQRPVFFLLDEIFKGTNSTDRHTGAKILISKLSNHGALGLVSTHDLELGELEKESNQKIKNYHFQEYYQDNRLFFDYLLRPGISTTRNALFLIKTIGIEIDEKDLIK
jgi:hypothetical protein